MTESVRKRSAIEPAEALLGRDAPLPQIRKRPITTTLGATFVLWRAVAGVLWIAAFGLIWFDEAHADGIDHPTAVTVFWIIAVAAGIGVLVLLLFAWLVWRGSNLARILVMAALTFSISTAAIAHFAGAEQITFRTTLIIVALDILVLLALSSRDARAWSRQTREHGRRA